MDTQDVLVMGVPFLLFGIGISDEKFNWVGCLLAVLCDLVAVVLHHLAPISSKTDAFACFAYWYCAFIVGQCLPLLRSECQEAHRRSQKSYRLKTGTAERKAVTPFPSPEEVKVSACDDKDFISLLTELLSNSGGKPVTIFESTFPEATKSKILSDLKKSGWTYSLKVPFAANLSGEKAKAYFIIAPESPIKARYRHTLASFHHQFTSLGRFLLKYKDYVTCALLSSILCGLGGFLIWGTGEKEALTTAALAAFVATVVVYGCGIQGGLIDRLIKTPNATR